MKRTYKIKATSKLKMTFKNKDKLKMSSKTTREDDLFLSKHHHIFSLLSFHLSNFLIETFLGIHCLMILSSEHEVTSFSQQGQILTRSVIYTFCIHLPVKELELNDVQNEERNKLGWTEPHSRALK